MGNQCTSSLDYDVHTEIENELKKLSNMDRSIIKILLLGSGECGKSTFLKQMKILHGKGFNSDEIFKFKVLIYDNIFESIHTLIDQSINLNHPLPLELINDSNLIKSVLEFAI